MPLKLVQNLLPITRFSIMKPNSTIKPTRVVPILSRVFPHKLKYQSLSVPKKLGFPKLGVNTSSQFGGSFRSFSTRRAGSDVRVSKSLIEDEAELSDWVGELRSDSFVSKSKVYSDSDDNGDSGRGRDRVSLGKRRREGENEGYGGSRGGRGGFSSSRGREDDFGSGFHSSRGRGREDEVGSGFRGSRGKGRYGGEFEGRRENGGGGGGYGRENGEGGYGRERGGLSSRGRGGESSRGRGGYGSRGRGMMDRGRGSRDSDSDDYGRGGGGLLSRGRGGYASRGGDMMDRGRGSRDSDSDDYGRRGALAKRGRGGLDSYDSSSRDQRGKGQFGGEMQGRNEEFVSRGKENGSRDGRNSSMGGRGGRGSELGYGRDQGGRGGLRRGNNGSPRGALILSDTDDVEDDEDMDEEDEDDDEDEDEVEGVGKIRDSFRELINEEDSEDDSGAVDGDEVKGVGKIRDNFRELSSEEDSGDDSEAIDENEDDDDEVLKKGSSFSKLDIKDGPVIPPATAGSDSYLSESRFDQCSVSSASLKAIKDAGYEKMTVVQEATLPVILKGKDVLAKARTGTGKTVAFLLPAIEVVSKSPPAGRDQKRPPIFVLVICPTRELASQAAAEANKLLKYHSSIGVQVVIGGTRLALEQKRMQANPCQILVATPGRLKDHIENTAGFATRLMGVKVLVLDEADHLLDMGFRKDIEKIIAAVPKQRQTLLFSATVPPEVRQICHIALKRDHEYINTVEEGSEETHAQVKQTHLVAPLDTHFPLLYALLKEHITDDVDYKVLVFCTTAMVTRLVADLLGELNLNVREIHSRKPQSYRTRVSDEFRKSKGLILVTSDVSARGVDYPDVTLVIQVGLPSDKEQYIHRLGRTGRKGKEGQGILLLAPWEEFFLSTIRDLPISKASAPSVDPDTKKKVEKALAHVEMKNKEAAYQAWLGYYNSNKTVGKDKYRLVELANDFSRCMGLDNPPAIPKLVLGKMGLRNVPGLRSK